jgi:phosphoribosylamine--glycine ligase
VKKIAVLISNQGTGTNLQAVIDHIKTGEINGKVVVVVSNAANAYGLERAKKNKIPTEVFPWKPYKEAGKSRAEYSKDLAKLLKKYQPDIIVFAGWILIVTKEFIDEFPIILNLHPGLIPDKPNGMVYFPDGTPAPNNKGVHTDDAIANFFKQKCSFAGSTLHVVTEDVDWGPVIERAFEKIRKGDSVDSLYSRLKKKEHQMLVRAVKLFCDDKLVVPPARSPSLPQNNAINVLIIGGGGREHTLVQAYAKSTRVKKIFVVPGNGLMGVFEKKEVATFPGIKPTDFDSIWEIVQKNKIDLVDVAQDDPLAAGGVDFFAARGVAAFGPTKAAAQIEWDKDWARNFMKKYHLPIPRFSSFSNQSEAINYLNKLPGGACFVKAAGLAAGKGAIKAENKAEAVSAIKQMNSFGAAGETFLIEEMLVGEEFSAYAICDGRDFQILKCAQDHKPVFNFDEGPNTGGMGAVAPILVVQKSNIKNQIKKIFRKTVTGLVAEGRPYTGILYLGGIITDTGVKIIEFNARWGDPEAQVVLPGVKNDYLEIVAACLEGRLNKLKIQEDNKTRICVVGACRGYPGDYSAAKGKRIFGLEEAAKMPGVTIFGAGIERSGKRFLTHGGRVFNVVARGKNIIDARNRAYSAMAKIFVSSNNLHYRTDIGWRDVERQLLSSGLEVEL